MLVAAMCRVLLVHCKRSVKIPQNCWTLMLLIDLSMSSFQNSFSSLNTAALKWGKPAVYDEGRPVEFTKWHHSIMFQSVKNPKYMFSKELNSEYQLWVLLRWLHYCDVACTRNTVSQCCILTTSIHAQLAKCWLVALQVMKRMNKVWKLNIIVLCLNVLLNSFKYLSSSSSFICPKYTIYHQVSLCLVQKTMLTVTLKLSY